MIRAIIVPDDALVIDVAQQAAACGLHLIRHQATGRHVLCREVPPGWTRCAVAVRDARAPR